MRCARDYWRLRGSAIGSLAISLGASLGTREAGDQIGIILTNPAWMAVFWPIAADSRVRSIAAALLHQVGSL